MIYCLMINGGALTDIVRTQLFTVARQMVAKGVNKQRFRFDDCEGVVTTAGDSANVGAISGVFFSAMVETNSAKTRATFSVPTGELKDLDQAKWYELYPHWDDGPSIN